MGIKYSRRWPARWLALAAAASAVLEVHRASARRAHESMAAPAVLEALHRAAAAPEAGAEEWRRFAHALEMAGRAEHAIVAWTRAVALDPLDNASRAALATALAKAGRDEELLEMLDNWVLQDARAALRAMGRPEIARPDDARFRALLAEARSQAVD